MAASTGWTWPGRNTSSCQTYLCQSIFLYSELIEIHFTSVDSADSLHFRRCLQIFGNKKKCNCVLACLFLSCQPLIASSLGLLLLSHKSQPIITPAFFSLFLFLRRHRGAHCLPTMNMSVFHACAQATGRWLCICLPVWCPLLWRGTPPWGCDWGCLRQATDCRAFQSHMPGHFWYQEVCWLVHGKGRTPGVDGASGGRDSSVGSAWARCPQRRRFDPPLGTFSVEGIFPLELTWVQNSIPPKTPSDESINPGSSLYIHAFHRTDSKDPDVHVLDGWMPATKTHPARTIHEDGMWLP